MPISDLTAVPRPKHIAHRRKGMKLFKYFEENFSEIYPMNVNSHWFQDVLRIAGESDCVYDAVLAVAAAHLYSQGQIDEEDNMKFFYSESIRGWNKERSSDTTPPLIKLCTQTILAWYHVRTI
jgi:Fungal specific transcription factor domain